MHKWWWWWLPGWHKKWKLEKRRLEAISTITGERLYVELMAQRPRRTDDTIDSALLDKVLKRLMELEDSAKQATHANALDDISDDAELQGAFRAYFCPAAEIQGEGNLVIDLIEEWGVPKSAIRQLRDSLGKKLGNTDNPQDARGALRALFEERDSWSDYTDDYENTMRNYTYWLLGATIILPSLAVIAFHLASRFSPLIFFGLLFAGGEGGCASVMAKMPALDVSLSGELDAYRRRVFSRVGIGAVASLIACALLAWGLFPISIQNQTFADGLNACSASSATCTGVATLILLGVPMLLGFSERTLTSFENRFFGGTNKSSR